VYQYFVVVYEEQRNYFEKTYQQTPNCLNCVHLMIVAI
jgi:hypothetical protein